MAEDLQQLIKKAVGAVEVYEARRFVCYVETKEGGTEQVDLTLLDAGPGEFNRYRLHGKSASGRVFSGNPHETIEGAILVAHW